MPIYEFRCNCGKITEETYKVSECPRTVTCSVCGRRAKKIISARGSFLRDADVPWMDSAKRNLPNDAQRISTRSELNTYLKAKGLTATG